MMLSLAVVVRLFLILRVLAVVNGEIISEELDNGIHANPNLKDSTNVLNRLLQEADLIEMDPMKEVEQERKFGGGAGGDKPKNRRKRRKKGKKAAKDGGIGNGMEGETEGERHQPEQAHASPNQSSGGSLLHPTTESVVAAAKEAFVCKNDSMLGYVASNSPTKAIMYIISHNNDSDSIAELYRNCYGRHWIETATLAKSKFFESIIYHDFFPHHQKFWEKYDYVVTATYKTLTRQLLPRRIPVQTMQQIKQMLYLARDDPSKAYDVYPFFRDFEDVIPTSIKYHGPNFLKAWHLLLQQLGYSIQTIQRLYYIKGFYRNAFMIKPIVLKKLIHFMQQAMYIAENHEEIKGLLQSDAHYVWGKKEIANEIFNTSYYQLYPFVFERLPIFYLYVNNYKICIGPDTPCKYNYKG